MTSGLEGKGGPQHHPLALVAMGGGALPPRFDTPPHHQPFLPMLRHLRGREVLPQIPQWKWKEGRASRNHRWTPGCLLQLKRSPGSHCCLQLSLRRASVWGEGPSSPSQGLGSRGQGPPQGACPSLLCVPPPPPGSRTAPARGSLAQLLKCDEIDLP